MSRVLFILGDNSHKTADRMSGSCGSGWHNASVLNFVSLKGEDIYVWTNMQMHVLDIIKKHRNVIISAENINTEIWKHLLFQFKDWAGAKVFLCDMRITNSPNLAGANFFRHK